MFEAQLSQLLEQIADVPTIDTNVLVDAFLSARTLQLRTNLSLMNARLARERAHVDYLQGKLSLTEADQVMRLKIQYCRAKIDELEHEKTHEVVFNFMEHVMEHVPEVHATCEEEFARLSDVLLAKYYGDLQASLAVTANP
jgi:hypothetical protein